MYAQKDNDVYVNLFVSSDASLMINNKPVQIIQQNNYPWEGNLKFNVAPKSPLAFNLLVRIPGWADNQAIPSDLYKFASPAGKKIEIKINGQAVTYTMRNGYAVLNKNLEERRCSGSKLTHGSQACCCK